MSEGTFWLWTIGIVVFSFAGFFLIVGPPAILQRIPQRYRPVGDAVVQLAAVVLCALNVGNLLWRHHEFAPWIRATIAGGLAVIILEVVVRVWRSLPKRDDVSDRGSHA